jgi:hypothetical protein
MARIDNLQKQQNSFASPQEYFTALNSLVKTTQSKAQQAQDLDRQINSLSDSDVNYGTIASMLQSQVAPGTQLAENYDANGNPIYNGMSLTAYQDLINKLEAERQIDQQYGTGTANSYFALQNLAAGANRQNTTNGNFTRTGGNMFNDTGVLNSNVTGINNASVTYNPTTGKFEGINTKSGYGTGTNLNTGYMNTNQFYFPTASSSSNISIPNNGSAYGITVSGIPQLNQQMYNPFTMSIQATGTNTSDQRYFANPNTYGTWNPGNPYSAQGMNVIYGNY